MQRIVIVEDNKVIREELVTFFQKNGYEAEAPVDFEHILPILLDSHADLILLDINLPVVDGYYLCREVRRASSVPIIVVTSRDSELDELMSMNLGADDFITKPYHTQILLARVASVLRRANQASAAQDQLDMGRFRLNLARSSVEKDGVEVELTRNEFKILNCLCQHAGAIVSREELMRFLWDSDLFVDDNTLTVNINRLRRKLEELGLPQVIQTRRGQGYSLDTE